MSINTLDCPRCGAPLDPPGNAAATMECPYCKNTVIIPPELRAGAQAAPGVTPLPAEQLQEISDLVRSGNKIEAIKRVREWTKLGLKEAKDLVDAHERGEPLQINVIATGRPVGVSAMPEIQQLAELGRLVKGGQKIEAIRLLRNTTNLSLKEAKEMVEAMERGEPVSIVSQALQAGTTTEYTPSVTIPPGLEDMLNVLLKRNDRAGAVRLLRAQMDTSLSVADTALGLFSQGGISLVQALEQAGFKAAVERQLNPLPQVTIDEGQVRARRLGRAVAVTGGGAAGCSALFTIIILLSMLLPLVLVGGAMLSPEGPFGEVGSKLNPFAFARLDLSFGKEGSGQGFFQDIRYVAPAPDGSVYAADFDTGRVQHFDDQGNFLNMWIIPGTETQDEVYIQDIEVGPDGLVYITLWGDILAYDGSSGEVKRTVSPVILTSSGHEDDLYMEDLAFGPDGKPYALADSESLVRFSKNWEIEFVKEKMISSITKDSETITYISLDGNNFIYILAGNNYGVFKFDQDGNYLTRFGSQGDEPGQFRAVDEIDVDGYGRVFAGDYWGINVFDPEGRFLRRFSVPGVAFDLSFDSQNRLWLADNKQRVMRFIISEPAQE